MRSTSGCWTCRLRRKKCDEKHPVCDTCAALHITCHYGHDKPDWMDGGVRQEEMAKRLRGEVKEKAQYRRGTSHVSSDDVGVTEATTNGPIVPSQNFTRNLTSPVCALVRTEPSSTGTPQRDVDGTLAPIVARGSRTLERSDTFLVMYYLEHCLPFLFPFYRPSSLEGGRAWIMEMMLSSPVVRQATLCQSAYFFSLARATARGDVICRTVLKQTRDAFEMLRQALQVISSSSVTEHLHGAVRIMASIMQVQRFEIAALSFENCQVHLNAALALFGQLLESAEPDEMAGSGSRFGIVMSRLGPPSWIVPTLRVEIPSAEQAAFRFSSTLLVLDDIIASTVHQEPPRLYEYHRSLLGDVEGAEPPINIEAVVGCQNWVVLQIGEIAVLDAWKQECKRAGNLDIMELVQRATGIKRYLEDRLMQLERAPAVSSQDCSSLLDMFTPEFQQQSQPTSQSSLVTRVWAHAALLYLFVVVSGWQPASVDVRYHVGRIRELLTNQISPPSLLRTMVWPFCVAGCLAELSEQCHFRGIVDKLQPPGLFSIARKALDIMQRVWYVRGVGDVAERDLAACFQSQGEMVLLL